MKWPGDSRIWTYDAMFEQYFPGPSLFDGGDSWDFEDDDEDRPLPWRI